jgi:CDP-6-deoxy-D-xylo-4-hexulose-3-dehydrase
VEKIWYPTAYKAWDEEERDAIARVLASDRLTMGEETAAFERALAVYNSRKHAICVNSGSSANLIAVAALQCKEPRRCAVVPALAWATTYAPLVQHRIKLSLLDCDATWNATAYIGPVPDILVGCSILGNPARLDMVLPEGCSFLNDNCESLGAEIYGHPVGSYGDIATLSFYHSHQLSAVEGGACLTNDDELADLCRLLRDHGLTRTFKKADRFEDEFNFKLFGYNVRPTDIYSAIGRVQLRKLDRHRVIRRTNWYDFFSAADKLPITAPVMTPGFNPFGIHFTLDDASKRQELATALRAGGIDCRMPVGGSFRMCHYGQAWKHQQTPYADKIHRAGMFLGNAPDFRMDEQIERTVKVMKRVLTPH